MKKSDVKVGGVYAAKVTGKVVSVRIDGENPHGGWDATNLATGKKVRIKSAQRLRGPVKASREHLRAVHKADQENARLAEQRAKSPDGRTASERAMDGSAATAAQDRPSRKTAKKAKGKAKGTAGRDTGQRRATSGKRLSGLDAAAKVLAEAGEPLDCKTLVERMLAKGLWSTQGKTPAATIYAAMHREIAGKGNASRFRKAGRGKFTLAK
jgi:hypothetical protein